MALDNANFIAELSITDPPGTDPLSQGDDQIRTIKRATFQSFPLVAAAVNITDAQMNLMAIKDEVNVFTEVNIFRKNVALQPLDATSDIEYAWLDSLGITLWALRKIQQTTTNDFELIRNDAAGAPVDKPWVCDFTTGIVDFAQVPTVQGAPLWINGEVRMFIAAATPGTNWFLADGTNGTTNLQDRALLGSGSSSPGTLLAPNLVGTAAAGTTGSTALTEAQIAAHTHRIWSGGSATGITDVTFATADTVTGANRGNTAKIYRDTTASGAQIIEAAGSGSGHTHTSPAQAVTENGSDRQTVRPLSAVVEMHQYVP